MKFIPVWLPSALIGIEKLNTNIIIKRAIEIEIVSTTIGMFQFGMIILIGSIAFIPSLDPNIEILVFGYLFPLIKGKIF